MSYVIQTRYICKYFIDPIIEFVFVGVDHALELLDIAEMGGRVGHIYNFAVWIYFYWWVDGLVRLICFEGSDFDEEWVGVL